MATKPTTVPRWATGGTNNVTPSAGEVIAGYQRGVIPASGILNNRLKLIGEWAQYLSDGALSGNISIDGDLGVTGDTLLDGDLSVTGDTLLEGDTTTVTGTLVIGSGGDVDFAGAGTIKLPSFSEFFPAAAHGYLYSGAASLAGNYWSGGAVGVVHCNITLPAGFRITGIDVLYRRGGGTPQFDFYEITYDTLSASKGALAVAAGAADATTALGSFTSTTIAAGKQYVVQAAIGNAGDRFYGAIAHWDKPT